MDCKMCKEMLDAAFDAGAAASADAEAHAADCAPCGAYREKLHGLEHAFRAMPDANVTPELVARIQAKVGRPEVVRTPWRWIAPLAGACAAALAIAGWWYPLPLDAAYALEALGLHGIELNVDMSAQSLWAELQALGVELSAALNIWLDIPALAMWGILGGVLAAIVALNGWQARNLRME